VSHPRYTSEEIARRGQALYEERLRAKVDPRDRGKFLVLDIETGEHELDVDGTGRSPASETQECGRGALHLAHRLPGGVPDRAILRTATSR